MKGCASNKWVRPVEREKYQERIFFKGKKCWLLGNCEQYNRNEKWRRLTHKVLIPNICGKAECTLHASSSIASGKIHKIPVSGWPNSLPETVNFRSSVKPCLIKLIRRHPDINLWPLPEPLRESTLAHMHSHREKIK